MDDWNSDDEPPKGAAGDVFCVRKEEKIYKHILVPGDNQATNPGLGDKVEVLVEFDEYFTGQYNCFLGYNKFLPLAVEAALTKMSKGEKAEVFFRSIEHKATDINFENEFFSKKKLKELVSKKRSKPKKICNLNFQGFFKIVVTLLNFSIVNVFAEGTAKKIKIKEGMHMMKPQVSDKCQVTILQPLVPFDETLPTTWFSDQKFHFCQSENEDFDSVEDLLKVAPLFQHILSSMRVKELAHCIFLDSEGILRECLLMLKGFQRQSVLVTQNMKHRKSKTMEGLIEQNIGSRLIGKSSGTESSTVASIRWRINDSCVDHPVKNKDKFQSKNFVSLYWNSTPIQIPIFLSHAINQVVSPNVRITIPLGVLREELEIFEHLEPPVSQVLRELTYNWDSSVFLEWLNFYGEETKLVIEIQRLARAVSRDLECNALVLHDLRQQGNKFFKAGHFSMAATLYEKGVLVGKMSQSCTSKSAVTKGGWTIEVPMHKAEDGNILEEFKKLCTNAAKSYICMEMYSDGIKFCDDLLFVQNSDRALYLKCFCLKQLGNEWEAKKLLQGSSDLDCRRLNREILEEEKQTDRYSQNLRGFLQ
eukprot:GHVP01004888.1.p1 GENE.GHVP01004888.1~~GHVP01004888.1.p1  ORF type:complete len:589 (-),score=117.15 GHVP01004888.1:91-1857(-)